MALSHAPSLSTIDFRPPFGCCQFVPNHLPRPQIGQPSIQYRWLRHDQNHNYKGRAACVRLHKPPRHAIDLPSIRAFDFGDNIGTPPNLYVVINLRERPEAATAAIFQRIRHKYCDWLNYQRKLGHAVPPPAYVFTFENTGCVPHVNWVLHVPNGFRAEFERKLPRWVRKAQGACGPFDVRCEPVTHTPKSLAKYIVKGTDPAFVSHFYLSEVHAPQGTVYGKRAGVSPALGATARKQAGFHPRLRRGVRPWRHAPSTARQQIPVSAE